MFCKIRRKIKQSDGKNQVKRKLLICSKLLTVMTRFAKAKRNYLGEGAAHLDEEAMPLQDHPRVHLGELCRGKRVRLGEACLHRGEGRICQMKTPVFAKAKDNSLR